MSITFDLNTIPDNIKEEIMTDLVVSPKTTTYNSRSNDLYAYSVIDSNVFLPFYYGIQKFKKVNTAKFTHRDINFNGALRDYQLDVVSKAIQDLNKTRCTFLSMATGKGKTLTSIYIATRLKVKVCVLLFRVNLFEQWEESIKKVIPNVKIQVLDSTSRIDNDMDFYLINPINVAKRNIKDFTDIGLLIADEAHALCSEKLSKAFFHFQPKWCIGLSATPERSDDMHKILDLHFGPARINIPLYVKHDYYRFNTGLKPDVKYNMRGETDWNSILEFQATHEQRNKWIVKMCSMFPTRNILILCKRKSQTEKLYEMLIEEKESVDFTTGTKKKFDKEARILVTTFSKSGVGFDHPKLDMMIVASDVEEMFEQYFGRCVRREDSSPIFIDLVDDHKTLERHFGSRKSYAKSVGGSIKDFSIAFPNFNTS